MILAVFLRGKGKIIIITVAWKRVHLLCVRTLVNQHWPTYFKIKIQCDRHLVYRIYCCSAHGINNCISGSTRAVQRTAIAKAGPLELHSIELEQEN